MKNQRGFTLLELIVTVGILGVLAAVGIGITNTLVRMTRGEQGAQQLDAFLKRHREMAVARRRDIEIRFLPPNQVQSFERAVPVDPPGVTPGPTELELMTFEGGIQYRQFAGMFDTPNMFGYGVPIDLGGATPVMFSSEGAFIDADNNPVNATISMGIQGDSLSATAVTILGPTASIERWRWTGAGWTK